MLYGDFNDEPETFREYQWLESNDAVIVGPFTGTCRSQAGEGRNIDFVIASNSIAPFISKVEAVWDVPFAPHAAIRVTIQRDPRLIRETVPIKPRAFEPGFLPWVNGLKQEELTAKWQDAQRRARDLVPVSHLCRARAISKQERTCVCGA